MIEVKSGVDNWYLTKSKYIIQTVMKYYYSASVPSTRNTCQLFCIQTLGDSQDSVLSVLCKIATPEPRCHISWYQLEWRGSRDVTQIQSWEAQKWEAQLWNLSLQAAAAPHLLRWHPPAAQPSLSGNIPASKPQDLGPIWARPVSRLRPTLGLWDIAPGGRPRCQPLLTMKLTGVRWLGRSEMTVFQGDHYHWIWQF